MGSGNVNVQIQHGQTDTRCWNSLGGKWKNLTEHSREVQIYNEETDVLQISYPVEMTFSKIAIALIRS